MMRKRMPADWSNERAVVLAEEFSKWRAKNPTKLADALHFLDRLFHPGLAGISVQREAGACMSWLVCASVHAFMHVCASVRVYICECMCERARVCMRGVLHACIGASAVC